jgi:ribosome-binding ATPase YchF (GTP1/OBG family)
MDIALIGLASAGKTSLLKALAAGHLPHHGSPNEPAVAVVKVPDERLDQLATLVEAKKTTYLELRLLDFPPLSSGKKGPPPQLLGTLSTADLLVHIVRAFHDEAVPHPLESVDPARDIAAIDLELADASRGSRRSLARSRPARAAPRNESSHCSDASRKAWRLRNRYESWV